MEWGLSGMWVKMCVCKRISGDADDEKGRKRVGGVSALLLCLSIVGRLLAAFHVGFPTHIIHMCQMLYSQYTHTLTHTRHMSLFVLVCCRDKTRLCYTPLQGRQRALISHTVSVCVCARERMCVCDRVRVFLQCSHFLQAGFSASLAGI